MLSGGKFGGVSGLERVQHPGQRQRSPIGLQAWEKNRKGRSLRPVQLKRKETWDFPNLRGLALRLAETITRIRSSWSHRDPGSFQTWARVLGQQGWPSRGLLPKSPRLQTNSQEDKCLPPKGFRTSQSSPLTLAPTHALPSGVGVVARGWGVRPPEAGSEHN